MKVEVSVRIDGREVACVQDRVSTHEALQLENQIEQLKDRVGVVLLEQGFEQLAEGLNHPCCCGRKMRNQQVGYAVRTK